MKITSAIAVSKPFLTDLDSRAAIKGSRDPLGLVPVWSRFGRTVVGNLTTVSGSVSGFTTLLLGYYVAEEIRRSEPDEPTLSLFLKFEQLAGYARHHVRRDRGFRGVERVGERLQKSTKVMLGSATTHQILSSQQTYGLWGLFTVPARDSGLLSRQDPVLTPVTREFVERQYIRVLTKAGLSREILKLVRDDPTPVFLDGRHRSLAEAIANIFSREFTASERDFYYEHLANGGPDDRTNGRQRRFANLLARLPADTPFNSSDLNATIRRAGERDGDLAERLQVIADVEKVLVPMQNAFAFLLARDRQRLPDVIDALRKTWGRGLRHIRPESIAAVKPTLADAFQNDDAAAERIWRLAVSLTEGSYDQVLRMLLEHNAYVMDSRNGSQPWVRVENGKLDVRYHDEAASLISRSDLPHAWRNSYFINSLKVVVSDLRTH